MREDEQKDACRRRKSLCLPCLPQLPDGAMIRDISIDTTHLPTKTMTAPRNDTSQQCATEGAKSLVLDAIECALHAVIC